MTGLWPYSGSQVMLGSRTKEDKQGAESYQTEVLLTLGKSKGIIFTIIGKYTTMTQKTKSIGHCGFNPGAPLERAKSVVRFRLKAGHNFLGVYLHWLGLAADEACPLCGHARMDGDHLLQCTGLDEYTIEDIVSRYWEARRQMVKLDK
ncbi:reverse transcriptase [Trichonephila clavipes]|uniref:Reverse transcriptase n=1 Tax=Trichonephila clavipes TaxID=2585209 RepID=A0A8X7BDD8_TRICX|nr:reverse transcriptase [Trichonephila clavipes]